MTRAMRWLLAVTLLLTLAWGAALVLLNTSPRWLARSAYGERAYGVLVVVAFAGLRAWPFVLGAAVLLGAALWWRRARDRAA